MRYALAIALALVAVQARAQLKNPDFETPETINSGGIPNVLNDWEGNVSEIVGAENGITPFSGNRMLRFLLADGSAPSGGIGVGVRQLIEAQHGTWEATAVFNRVSGDAQTDTEFRLEVEAYNDGFGRLAFDSFALLSDSDPITWEPARASLTLPAGTRYVGVHLLALENVFNDDSGTEFDGHYVDAVTLVPEPATWLLIVAGLVHSVVILAPRVNRRASSRFANHARYPHAQDSALTGSISPPRTSAPPASL